MKILVVDDKREDLYLLETLLSASGYEVSSAANGAQALEVLRVQKIDMVVSDILMPVMDGFQLCRAVKKDAELSDIIFVFYTASYTDPRDEDLALRVGADRFVRKPTDPEDFIEIIRGLLRDAEAGRIRPRKPEVEEEDTLRLYSERLVSKLEEKVLALEREVAERTRVEGELREAAEKREELEHIVNHSPAVAFLWKAAEGWPVEYVSDNVVQFGYRPEDFADGQFLFISIVHPDDLDRVSAEVARYSEEGRTDFAQDYRILDGSGQVRWLDDRTWIRRGPDGVITHYQGIVLDITERKRVETALRRSEADYRAIVQNATYGIFRSTPEGRFLSFNRALMEILGYESEDEVMELDLATDIYVDPNERSRLIERYANAQSRGGLECEWKRKDGTPITVRLSGHPVHGEDGEPAYFEIFAEDVTERRLLEAQLRQAQKMEAVGQLTGGVAHDFNNLLSVILANIPLVSEFVERHGEEDVREGLVDIEVAARRGAAMIEKLLGVSRSADLAMTTVDLGQAVHGVLAMLSRVIPADVRIEFSCDAETKPVRTDPGAVEQILLNLATNARDAMPEGGDLRLDVLNVRVEASELAEHPGVEPGEYVLISASDTGEGMDEATLERIFDPFYTTKAPGTGTGLGMAMVYGLMQQQGGFVKVRSKAGGGTTVDLYFPATREEEVREAPEREAPEGELRGGTETILCVEDDDPLRRTGIRILRKFGYTVIEAENGTDALEKYREHGSEIDLILSDLVMPGMGGWELHQAVRSTGGTVPFLITTGYSGIETRERAGVGSDVPVLQKPWDVDDFVRAVRRILDANG